MSYTPVGWKDYPDKTTPMSSANFRKMDEKILELDTAMGETDISGIGDGTVKGAIAEQKEALVKNSSAITELKSNMIYTTDDITTSCKLSASGYEAVTLDIAKEGYKPIALSKIYPDTYDFAIVVAGWDIVSDSRVDVFIKSLSGGERTFDLKVKILYIKVFE